MGHLQDLSPALESSAGLTANCSWGGWRTSSDEHRAASTTQLAILDGRQSNQYLHVILYVREHHIHMLSLPRHTSHMIPHFGRTIFRSIKAGYNVAAENCLRTSRGRGVTLYETGQLLGKVFSRMATPGKAMQGSGVTEDSSGGP